MSFAGMSTCSLSCAIRYIACIYAYATCICILYDYKLKASYTVRYTSNPRFGVQLCNLRILPVAQPLTPSGENI